MQYYVYIIQSERTGKFYKGYSSNPEKRLSQHNMGMSRFTANRGPWKLVYLEKMNDKKSALIREKQLKRANMNYLNWLIGQDLNMMKQ